MGRNNFQLAILIPLWGRSRLSQMVIENTRDLSVPGVDVRVVTVWSPEDEDLGDMIHTPGVTHVMYPNKPVSNKWNQGCHALEYLDFDAMMVVGSDDFINATFVRNVVDQIEAGAEYVLPQQLWFYDTETRDLVYCRATRVGCGRTITRDVCERLGFNPWRRGFDRGVDGAMDKRLAQAGIEITHLPDVREGGGLILDVKTSLNMWTYKRMKNNLDHDQLEASELRVLVPDYADRLLNWH